MSERIGSLSLEEAIDRVASRGDLLVGVDFDGVLAPIVDHPDDAVPDERAIDLLRELAGRRGLKVAVVSGRARDDLDSRLGEIPRAVVVGEHGNDIGAESCDDHSIADAAAMIESIADPLGVVVERKRRSVTFHYRNLPEEDADHALEQIRSWADEHDEVSVLEGKKVIELTTATRDKGDAIRDLAGAAGIIYVGDDTTDEKVFEILGPDDVGVKVGDGATSASHRVEDIDGVVTILTQIALASG
jgi:trehalose 6-phosphate phosphatase